MLGVGVLCGSGCSRKPALGNPSSFLCRAQEVCGGVLLGAVWSSHKTASVGQKDQSAFLGKVSSSKERGAGRLADGASSESSSHQRDGEASLRSNQEIKHEHALWAGMDVSPAQLKALPQVKRRSQLKGVCSFPQLWLAQTDRTISEVT